MNNKKMDSEKNQISLNSNLQTNKTLASILLAPIMSEKDIQEIKKLTQKIITTNEKAEIIWVDESLDTQDKNNLKHYMD